ncbi:hypothetical protein [Streptomyces sp. NPDC050738]|uniref:hypothetical protein n=1 Tax=Streptomyces sp. NPDC050738 TaxID=3154744 RepID=UPI00342C7BB8
MGPKAAAVEMSFSGGGKDAPLLKIARDGRSLELGWRGTLPKPTLEGANALYSEVLPGVDLQMAASVEGAQDFLIVKTPEAAANPALKQIEFSLKSAGLKISESAAGGLRAVDANASDVFVAPPALMWDSAGDAW